MIASRTGDGLGLGLCVIFGLCDCCDEVGEVGLLVLVAVDREIVVI
jgi:hypothetical protein